MPQTLLSAHKSTFFQLPSNSVAGSTPPLNFSILTASEWCDLASLVWATYERRCGNQVTTHVRCFACPPRPSSCCKRDTVTTHSHHRVLAVVFGEGNSRIRTGHAAHYMTIPSASPITFCRRIRPSKCACSTSGRQRLGTRIACVGWPVSSPNPFICNRHAPQAVSALCRSTNPMVSNRIHANHSSGSA